MVLQAERTYHDTPPVDARTESTIAADSMVVSFWTIVSRVTGLVRLAAIAAVLGPTFMGNTFQAANLVPNAVYEFLTGSLLVNVLVPHLVRHIRPASKRDVERVAGGFLGVATLGCTIVVGLLLLARPLLLHGFTAAVRDPATAAAQRRVGSLLLAFILPQIVLYVVAGTAGAVMNANGRFALPAAGPAVENIGTIATILVAGAMFGTGVDVKAAPHRFLLVLGIGATGAVLLHASILWFGCLRSGIRLVPRLRVRDADVRAVVRDLAPTIGQAGLNALRTMTSLVVGNVIAGGVVAFQLALTFFYLPPAISAKAVGVAMLRRLSITHEQKDDAGFSQEFGHGIRLTAFVTIPSAVAFLVLAFPLVRGLSFGEMATPRSIALAALALTALAPGVLGESAYLLGTYAAYARGDARSPFRSALLRTILSVGGMLLAARFVRTDFVLFLLGAAITLGNFVGAAHLLRRLRGSLPPMRELASACRRIGIASLLMTAVTLVTYRLLDPALHTVYPHSVAIALAVAAGCLTYLVLERGRSPELAMFTGAIASRVLHAPNMASSVVFESDNNIAQKLFPGPDGLRRAVYEFDRLYLSSQALRGHEDITPVRAVELVTTPTPAVRMSRVDGVCLSSYLAEAKLSRTELERIARVIADGVRSYTKAAHEPYFDFHLRNCVIDPATGRVALLDFGIPEHFADASWIPGSPLDVSIGNLLGSTIFEAARPYQLFRTRQRRQSALVCRHVIASFSGTVDMSGVERATRLTYTRCANQGGRLRRLWYRTGGAVAARAMRKRFPEITSTRPVAYETKVRIAAAAAAIVAAPVAVLSPFRGVAALCALALVTAVAVYPPIAAYALLGATPLVVGINRGSALPLLRPHEALVLLIGGVLAVRTVVSWTINGWPSRLRLPSVDVSIALLVITGSIIPVAWMIARGQPLSRDDLLYALVIWKYAGTYLIVRGAVRSEHDVRRALALSITATCIVAVIGILQALKLFGVPSFLMHMYAPDGMTNLVSINRATSTIGNSIALADVMVIHIGIVIAWMIRTRRHQLLLSACALLFCLAALASGQMSGVIGLFVTLGAIVYITGRVKQVAIAAGGVLIVATIALQPVIHQRLTHVDHASRLPQSWIARGENLKEYFLPSLAAPQNILLGVRPAARAPSREPWRDWVYIESGWLWLLWTGGIPLAVAFFLYLKRAMRETATLARKRAGPVGIAATGAFVALVVLAALMPLDPHLTMRGSADLTFALLGLALCPIAGSFVGRRVPAVRVAADTTHARHRKRVCIVRHRDYEPKVRREAEALVEAGYRVDVICLREPGHGFVEEDNGVRLIRLPMGRKRAGAVRYLVDYLTFFAATAVTLGVLDLAHHYAAIQVSTMPDFLVFATMLPRLRGAKIVAFMQEPSPELGTITFGSAKAVRMLARIEQAALRYADASLTVTEQLKARYVERGADPDKIHVVLNGPDPSFMQTGATLQRDPTRFTLLCHGSIEQRYGHEDLLEAVRIARTDVPGLHLDITGSGSDAERIEGLIEEMGLAETVTYHGVVGLAELRARIAVANVGIVAMRDTAYANLVHTNKMFDFIIASTPVIATRLDAVEAYFPPDAVAFVAPDDPKSLASVIVELYRDPFRREAMTARASELYGSYGWPHQKQLYVKVVDEMVGA